MAQFLPLSVLAGALLLSSGGFSFAESNCGERSACHTCCRSCCCRHHHDCCCCDNGNRSRSVPFGEVAPRAAIVESMPVFQMTPGVVAMPMMMASFGASANRSVPTSRDQSCAGSKDRVDELEIQVEALNVRMKTIQRSMEIQVRLLEEMKAEGKFPNRYLPQAPGT